MSDTIIQVENLGKKYRIRHQREAQRYAVLRDVLMEKAGAPWRWLKLYGPNGHGGSNGGQASGAPSSHVHPPASEDFWALKGVSFEVKRGEVVGIIGRNGAGKTTLLKILSRITEPTEGRVRLRGRVASLLEVGTGFHPELTGRENIFLNGAVLGMSKAEIKRKFDEIVAFAEVETFLDTPVKRYSSGMYVRLAFAVAAHLEPEILVVDEVLAVGDAEFQKKCLGKMQEVSRGGRTVLFVSHNMAAVRALCPYGVLLRDGSLEFSGAILDVVKRYENEGLHTGSLRRTWPAESAPGDRGLRLLSVEVIQTGAVNSIDSSKPMSVVLEVDCAAVEDGLCIGFELIGQDGSTLWWSYHTDTAPSEWPALRPGRNRLVCRVPEGWLNAGSYSIAPRIGIHNRFWIVNIDPCVSFNVSLNHGCSPYWTALSTGRRPGVLAPILRWEVA